MTRETKVGLVVAVSFLSLVGVVVASRMRKAADNHQEAATQVSPKEGAGSEGTNEAKPGTDHDPTIPGVISATLKETSPALTKPEEKPFNPFGSGTGNLPNDLSKPPLLPSPSGGPGSLDLSPPNLPGPAANSEEEQKKMKEALAKAQFPLAPANPVKPEEGPRTVKPPAIFGSDVSLPQPPPVVGPLATDKKDFPPLADPKALDAVPPVPGLGTKPLAKDLEPKKDPWPGPVPGPLPPPADFGPGQTPTGPGPVPPPQDPKGPETAPAPGPFPVAPPAKDPPTIPQPGPSAFPSASPTDPTLAPVGAETKNPMPPIGIPPLAIKPPSVPQVTDVAITTHPCTPSDTSFEAVSNRFFGSGKYARAILEYNRKYGQSKEAYLQDNPRLQPGQKVLVPPVSFLESRYANLIGNAGPAGPGAFPPISIKSAGALTGGNPNLPTIGTPSAPTADATKRYRVQGQGQMLYEIAQQTLGNGGRWSEIYRLNPGLNPQFPIPGGTEVQLPANAVVP